MKTKILIFLITLSILAVSCCIETEIGRYDLTDAQKMIIPYKNGQIISFIDNYGGIVDFTVTENERWCRWDEDDGPNRCNNYYNLREKFVKLKSKKYYSEFSEFSLRLSASGFIFGTDDCDLDISFTISERIMIFVLTYNAEGNIFTNSFHESYEINGKPYYDVIEQNSDLEIFVKQPKIHFQLFYNKEYGILQISKEGEILLKINN